MCIGNEFLSRTLLTQEIIERMENRIVLAESFVLNESEDLGLMCEVRDRKKI